MAPFLKRPRQVNLIKQIFHLQQSMLRSIKSWVQCTTSLNSSSQPKIKTIYVKQYHQFSNSIFESLPTFLIVSKSSLSNRKIRKLAYKSIPIIKKHSTVKYLISCSSIGAVTFLSPWYGGPWNRYTNSQRIISY